MANKTDILLRKTNFPLGWFESILKTIERTRIKMIITEIHKQAEKGKVYDLAKQEYKLKMKRKRLEKKIVKG